MRREIATARGRTRWHERCTTAAATPPNGAIMHSVTPRVTSTHDKALEINLETARYGTFAEIGGGQEVARWFFRVGGAAGTIAKTISAYDMAVSDAIYGQAERYVSRARLEAMLNYEQELNLTRLGELRGSTTAFFAFANTVSARNYRGTNECHGWIGVKFQSHPRDEDSRILLHVRMLDRENAQQQEALGIVGVNLLYGAFRHFHEPERLIESLLDGLSTERLEIDMIEFSGIEFRHVDNRLMSMKLVELGLSRAAMFGPNGDVLQPSEVLYKKNVLVMRGSFRPVSHAHIDMLRSGRARFDADLAGERTGDTVELAELTLRNLRGGRSDVDHADFLARADTLAAVGKTVLISDYFEFHRLARYVGRHAKGRNALVVGAGSLAEIFDERSYAGLDGGILEALGRLFANGLALYVYPLLDPASGRVTTAQNFEPAPHLQKLYEHLVSAGSIRTLDDAVPDAMRVFSRDVLARLEHGDPSWQAMVPAEVARVIRDRREFGYRPERERRSA
jgi:hypothetical protein